MNDHDAAAAIHEAKIDILVDLTMHTAGGRPAIAAYKPAPVQLHYLGYTGTSGAPWIDYIIGDAIVTPEEHEAFYSEAIARVPGSLQLYHDQEPIPEKALSRKMYDLPDDRLI